MDEVEFKRRTKGIGLGAIALSRTLPRDQASQVVARQLIRSATSVGANYRSACRGRSTADVLSRLAIVEEEADETLYWLELLEESGSVPPEAVAQLKDETNQVVAMVVASIRTLRNRSETNSR